MGNDKYGKISNSLNLFEQNVILRLKNRFAIINSYDSTCPILLRSDYFCILFVAVTQIFKAYFCIPS